MTAGATLVATAAAEHCPACLCVCSNSVQVYKYTYLVSVGRISRKYRPGPPNAKNQTTSMYIHNLYICTRFWLLKFKSHPFRAPTAIILYDSHPNTMTQLVSLAAAVKKNLEDEHGWRMVHVHERTLACGRPILSGLPPKRLYIHPTDQVAMIHSARPPESLEPQLESVIPLHVLEKASVASFAAIFDSIPSSSALARPKRAVIAIVQDDSTVVYYIIHDGLVKPRQN